MEKLKEKEVIVKCLACKEEVKVKLVRYADGHIAVCPLCGKLAYSGE
jgi:Zn finger protein HypA/HybF involved in hydrogenase expression